MTDDLYQQQVLLEEETRGLTIKKFHKDHLEGTLSDTFSETFLGTKLVKAYLEPFTQGYLKWSEEANSGKVGRRSRAAILLEGVDPYMIGFLTVKTIINQLGIYNDAGPCGLTSLSFSVAQAIHEELRLAEFDKEYKKLSKTVHADFNKRELPHEKRLEYMQRVFKEVGLDWSIWSKSDMLFVGTALLDVFNTATGDLTVESVGRGTMKRDVVLPSESLKKLVEEGADQFEALLTQYMPTLIPPRDWSVETLEMGGYYTENVTHYPLVKRSAKRYRKLLRRLAEEGKIDRVLAAVNLVQSTPWQVNKRVLEAIEYVYKANIPCGKLPTSDKRVPDEPSPHLLDLPADHPEVMEYRAYRFRVHEHNRRSVGKRVMAARSFQLAHRFTAYERFYFPHDLDSRGRMYPKASALNPQGPDYVKGLLTFADGKPLGIEGLYWLGIHGANCFGFDKADMSERNEWAIDHVDQAIAIAADPFGNIAWTKADNPCQYLAWCFEWAAAWQMDAPEEFVSYLHVDLDATCSGLQHFSAMLLDEVGGFHVNMVPGHKRQDVYGAVAKVAIDFFSNDDNPMSKAWIDFGVDRGLTKRPVMVKPYSGTRTSCGNYVADSVDEKLEDGFPMPVEKDKLWEFKQHGANGVWAAIPKVVVAADGAMKWLMGMARAVGKSQPEAKRIEWTTPAGFPVWQSKFNLESLRVKTFFNGAILRPRYNQYTDTLDSRQMASSVPPSFVHSLDGCHLMLTVSAAGAEGIKYFAVVHDSFGCHAADVGRFSQIIREQFVWMYQEHDVLAQFQETVMPLIDVKFRDDLPKMPPKGNLDLAGIRDSEFFFS